MAATDPQPTLRALLARADLALRLASDEAVLPPEALDTPLRWVHSSDLADPTPFLADDLLLLTTGTQFMAAPGGVAAPTPPVHPANTTPAPTTEDAYVARLRARGVRGLGFGTEVVRDGIPAALLDACRDQGMPLFEVPYRTPFIALARANAEAIAAQAYARRTWALSAQRAISLAALRPDGLGATVAELAKQLDAWVGLYDAAGVLTSHRAPRGDLDPDIRAAVDAEAGAVLRRGARAASQFESNGTRVTLQTLGRGGHLRGLIAIVGTELDLEGRSVVTSVIAMAGLALEQNVGLGRARGALRAALVQALQAGDVGLARRVSKELWGPLPPAPVVVAVAPLASGRADAATDWLELRTAERRGALFHGRGADGHVIVVPAGDADLLETFAGLFDAAVGIGEPVDYAGFARAHEQAVVAARRADAGTVASFSATAGGVFAALDTAEGRALAQARLRPLHAHDQERGSQLTETVRTWLAHDARIDEAAHALGIHRHTVRARVAQAQQVLGVDLSSFPTRAELWAALVAAG